MKSVEDAANASASAKEVHQGFVLAFKKTYPVALQNAFQRLIQRRGGSVTVSEAAKLYGVGRSSTVAEVQTASRNGSVIAIKDRSGTWLYPVWQFGDQGGTIKGLGKILKLLRKKRPDFNELTPFTFFLMPSPLLGGETPIDALRKGMIHEVEKVVYATSE